MSYHGAHPSLPSERFLHNSAGEGMLVESLEKFLAEGSDASRKRGREEESPNVSPLLVSKSISCGPSPSKRSRFEEKGKASEQSELLQDSEMEDITTEMRDRPMAARRLTFM